MGVLEGVVVGRPRRVQRRKEAASMEGRGVGGATSLEGVGGGGGEAFEGDFVFTTGGRRGAEGGGGLGWGVWGLERGLELFGVGGAGESGGKRRTEQSGGGYRRARGSRIFIQKSKFYPRSQSRIRIDSTSYGELEVSKSRSSDAVVDRTWGFGVDRGHVLSVRSILEIGSD